MKKIILLSIILLIGCTNTEQQPTKSIEFKSPCGPMQMLVCFERIDRECYCEDPLKMQREMENLLRG